MECCHLGIVFFKWRVSIIHLHLVFLTNDIGANVLVKYIVLHLCWPSCLKQQCALGVALLSVWICLICFIFSSSLDYWVA